jgi:hypothetical protein
MKNKKISVRTSIVFLLFLHSVSILSQSINNFIPKNNIPTSPEAALLGRFGDIPISYYTGTANISIPIYSIKESNIEVPITLNYHASGIKVEDQATWVGLGWDLSPGGSIIQEVRGIRDELDNNLNYGSNQTGYNNFKNRVYNSGVLGVNKNLGQLGRAFYEPCANTCGGDFIGSEPGDDTGETITSLLVGNGQPDIYHYNFGNYSGRFYINPENQQFVQIDKKEDLYFQKTISGITITTLDGVKYSFNTTETAYQSGFYDSNKAGKTFKLSEIKLVNGKKIFFSYIDAHFIDFNYSEDTILYDYIGGPSPVLSLNTRQSDIKILSTITTSDLIVNFNLENREDIIANPNNVNNLKRLKSITITSLLSNKKIRTFEFGYSYFPFDTAATPNGYSNPIVNSYQNALGKRLKLDNLKEVGYSNDATQVEDRSKPSHIFEYDLSNIMPLKISLAKDFWGYFNGQPNNNLLPDLQYFQYPDKYRAQTNNIPFTYNYTGANRYTNNDVAGTYMLNKITYPTGGYSQFEYEPNSFSNQFIPNIVNKSVADKNYDVNDNNDTNNTVTQTFKLSKEVNISFDNRITATNVNSTPWTYAQMLGCYIEFKKTKSVNGVSTTTILKKWDLSSVLNVDFTNNSGKVWLETVHVPYDSSPGVNYTVSVYMPDNLNFTDNFYHSSGVRSHFKYADDIGLDTSVSNQCGMRIRSIKNFSTFGALTSNKKIIYYGGKLLNRFQPIDVLESYYFSCSLEPGKPCAQFSQNGPMNRITISSDNLISQGGNMIGYDSVDEVELSTDPSAGAGKKTYNYYNFDNAVSKGYPVWPNLRNGLLYREDIFNSSNQLVVEKNYSYLNLNPGIVCYYGFTINTHFFGPDPQERAVLGGRHKYSYNVYPILSEWNKLDNVVTKEYLEGNTLTSIESYTYNSQGKLKTVTNLNSDNDPVVTTYKYANDYPDGNSFAESSMISANMMGIPLVTTTSKNGELLSQQKTEYAKDATTSNIILPKYIFIGKGAQNQTLVEKRVTCDQYDSKGNIQQYSLENGTFVTLLWGYGQTQPIAKIENATYSQVATALGISTSVLDTYTDINLTTINTLRSLLPNALTTTYTYIPLIGVNTITDPKGDKIIYTYDTMGRLMNVKDKSGNILSENKYQYKN